MLDFSKISPKEVVISTLIDTFSGERKELYKLDRAIDLIQEVAKKKKYITLTTSASKTLMNARENFQRKYGDEDPDIVFARLQVMFDNNKRE